MCKPEVTPAGAIAVITILRPAGKRASPPTHATTPGGPAGPLGDHELLIDFAEALRQWWAGRTGTFSREVAWMVLRAVVPTGECR